MSDSLVVELFGGGDMSDEQAKYFALSLFSGIKAYVANHRTEFETWERKQNSEVEV